MSIIAEALKKAEGLSTKKVAEKEPRIIALEIEKTKPAKTRRRLPFYISFFSVVLFTVLLFALSHGFFLKSKDEIIPEVSDSPLPSPPVNNVNENLPDQTLPPDVKSSVKLTGIMYAHDHPLAVINDNVWSENEYIGKARIAQIGKDFVKFEKDGAEFIVKLKR